MINLFLTCFWRFYLKYISLNLFLNWEDTIRVSTSKISRQVDTKVKIIFYVSVFIMNKYKIMKYSYKFGIHKIANDVCKLFLLDENKIFYGHWLRLVCVLYLSF